MAWLVENLAIIVGLIAVLTLTIGTIIKFIKTPRESQINKVKEWLLYAVCLAEKEFGSGTGELKLRYVYDMFLKAFPALSNLISFEYFSKLVDEALDKMKDLLATNASIKNLI